MFLERVSRVDFFEFMPDAAGLVEIAEIPKRGNKYRARKVCSRHQEDALPQHCNRCFIPADKKIRYAQQM